MVSEDQTPAVYGSGDEACHIAQLFVSLTQLVANGPDHVFGDVEVQRAGRCLLALIEARLDAAARPDGEERLRLLTPVVDIGGGHRPGRTDLFPRRSKRSER